MIILYLYSYSKIRAVCQELLLIHSNTFLDISPTVILYVSINMYESLNLTYNKYA